MSSSSAKPCTHHTVAVVAAALAIKGRVTRPAAGRLVPPRAPPAVTHAGAVDPVDAGDRAILDREGEGGFGMEVERKRQSGADRAAMRDGDDVASGMCLDQPVNCP